MAELLASGTISGELFSNTDKIFDGEAMPINTSVVSSVIDFGKTLNALELVGTVVDAITIAATYAMTITVSWDTDAAGSFTDSLEVASYAPGTIAAGAELFRYVADHTKPVYYKVTIASTDIASVGSFDVDIASVRK